MYLELVRIWEMGIVVKDGLSPASTKQVSVPRTARGDLDLPWGRCSARELFFKARAGKVGDIIHVKEQ